MCGLTGYWQMNAPADQLAPVAQAMGDRIVYRGPDDKDVWTDADAGFAFSNRRLSIDDLNASRAAHLRKFKIGIKENCTREQSMLEQSRIADTFLNVFSDPKQSLPKASYSRLASGNYFIAQHLNPFDNLFEEQQQSLH